MTRVGVLGAGGRMGRTVCAAVAADTELELVAVADPHHEGVALDSIVGEPVPELTVRAGVEELLASGVDVVVDFTVAVAARDNLARIAGAGAHAVVGTTGLDAGDLDSLREVFTTSNCIVAPNFSISAVAMMRLAELAAPLFDTVEIIEWHHDAKVDAPSGTALATAARIAEASSEWAPDPTRHVALPGARGGEGPGGVRVHAVRMRGMVAHQEVVFGAEGQTLTIRQDSYDRASFMPGVLLACKRIHEHPGLTVGLDALLGL